MSAQLLESGTLLKQGAEAVSAYASVCQGQPVVVLCEGKDVYQRPENLNQ
jgi:hypothetical protein